VGSLRPPRPDAKDRADRSRRGTVGPCMYDLARRHRPRVTEPAIHRL
jgi:hypothetical protein